jgi:hypothetical protein
VHDEDMTAHACLVPGASGDQANRLADARS